MAAPSFAGQGNLSRIHVSFELPTYLPFLAATPILSMLLCMRKHMPLSGSSSTHSFLPLQGPNAVTLAARLNQQALLPDMMFPTVNRFNPNNGQPLPTANGAF